MFQYEDGRGSIGICWEKGEVRSLKRGGKELTAGEAAPLFSFRLRRQDGGVIDRTAHEGALIGLSEEKDSAEAAYRFDGLEGTVVRLSVRFGGESWVAWRLKVENCTESAVEWAEYPQISLKKESEGRKASFYWPYNEGVQIDDIDRYYELGWGGRSPEFPGEGNFPIFPGMVESQFVAYELEGGVYLAAQDERRGIKCIDCLRENGSVRLRMRMYAGGCFGADYEAGYDVVLDLFEGGWTEAAELYRRWHDQHLPEGLLKIAENGDLPEWYSDSPVVVTYPVRGLYDTDKIVPNRLFPYENALPILDKLAEKMNCRVMALLMHWEGTAPWAPPFVWPPYGGEEMFASFVEALHARGHLVGVYLSGLSWTEQSNLMEEYNCEGKLDELGFRRSLCLSPEGTLEYSKICRAQRTGYDFCPMGEDTAGLIAAEAASIAASGVDYAQILDQNHGGNSYFCYSRDHGHAPTPGPWMTEAMNNLLDQVHEAAPGLMMGCESAAGEPYLKRLLLSDNRFNLGWYFGKPVPMFAYVYHEYLNNFMGNQVCGADQFEPDAESFSYRLAYAFAAGDLPTLVITDDGRIMQAWCDRQFDCLPDQEQVVSLVKNLTALRRGEGKKYLHEGRMVKPLPVEGAGERHFAMCHGMPDVVAPRVLTSRWQAADGSEKQALINWTTDEIICRVAGREVKLSATGAAMV